MATNFRWEKNIFGEGPVGIRGGKKTAPAQPPFGDFEKAGNRPFSLLRMLKEKGGRKKKKKGWINFGRGAAITKKAGRGGQSFPDFSALRKLGKKAAAKTAGKTGRRSRSGKGKQTAC